MKKYIFIIIMGIMSVSLFTKEIDPSELLNIIQNLEDRVKEIENLYQDEELNEIIKNIKGKIVQYKNEEVKIKDVVDEISEKIVLLEDRVKKLRFYNIDDELFMIINYLKNRLKKLDIKEKDKKLEELIHEKKDTKKKLETIENIIEEMGLEKIIEYLLNKIGDLENKIEDLSLDKKDEERLRKVEELEKTIEKLENEIEKIIHKKEEDVVVLELIKDIMSQDKNLQDKINKIIEERKRDKKILASPVHSKQWGKEFAFQLNLGLTGIYTTVTTGIMFPKIKNLCTMGLLFNFHVAMPGTFIAETYRTAIPSGTYFISFSTPMFANFMRICFGAEFQFGAIFSTTITDLFGLNFTFGAFGFGGIEFYLIKQIAFFIEAGAGIMYTFGDTTNIAIKNNNANGTGLKLNFGVRFYVAPNKKIIKRVIIEKQFQD